MTKKPRLFGLLIALSFALFLPAWAAAQTATLRGSVVDPSGAVVPGADVTLTQGSLVLKAKSGASGHYIFHDLAAGSYFIAVAAKGFAPLSLTNVAIAAGQIKELNLPLTIAVQQQEVQVEGQSRGISISPDQNASATVIRGSDLDALSDDPDELQSELQALAGPAAGPNGGQIYIDGFEGGQIPPKSSILEIRVNQNPFSAEYDRIGYGRIEIITKPGSQKLHGQLGSFGTDSVLDTKNPLVSEQPSYYLFGIFGNITGPVTKNAAYFFNAFGMRRQNQAIVDALNPSDLTTNITEAFPTPSSVFSVNPRVDFELGKNNMITVRDSIFRSTQTGGGVGTLNLPEQAIDSDSEENTLQVGETWVVNNSFVNETHLQWRRVRNSQTSEYLTPTIIVQGAFTTGGNSSGVNQDHEDDLELQNYSTATRGPHTFRFGIRLRSYRDANYSTSGSNGTYIFSSVAAYEANTPSQHLETVIANPLARALLFDGAAFFEDDWRVTPNFDLGLGLRFEGQNRIRDHADWAPRLSLAWSPGHSGRAPAKTVIRAGYGWFYNRFTVPNFFGSAAGAPYVVQAIHNNLINEQSYVVTSDGTPVPYYNTIDPHFHAALDMQGGIGVDRQIAKGITGNITYLYTQGVHQYLTDDITAPTFDAASYTVTGATPSVYNYQFQSGGVYKEHQLILTTSVRWKKIGLNGNYTFTVANSDTQGINSQPSDEQDPGLDYGRASFGIRHRMFLLGTYMAPYKIVIAPLLVAQSGTPYNLTIGRDLTGNNQFDARPAYGVCGQPNVVATQYGCLDTDPVGTGERMVPYDLGTGPASVMFHVRVSKVVGVGPRIETKGQDNGFRPGNNSVSGRGLSGGGAPIHLDATAPRKFNLTFAVAALNVFNVVNLGPPNGVLDSPLFNKTQSLAGGPYSLPIAGNRAILFQMMFGF
ncbi:MAG TPA: carboxypeptidase regulatory-like domain-containing protein [Terracidiphilus sp.]|nr:carboxypeptidase regulatory-like domain-containing protein [Terracidiphilus sp.]